jgi:hypothetical protein
MQASELPFRRGRRHGVRQVFGCCAGGMRDSAGDLRSTLVGLRVRLVVRGSRQIFGGHGEAGHKDKHNQAHKNGGDTCHLRRKPQLDTRVKYTADESLVNFLIAVAPGDVTHILPPRDRCVKQESTKPAARAGMSQL